MRVLIADDEELIRFSVADMLRELPAQIVVAGEATTGTELVERCPKLQPDVAFVDVRMPGIDGLAAIELLRRECPHTDWVILTSYSEFDYARRAINAGVVEYLLKPVGPDELEGVIGRLVELRRRRVDMENERFENTVSARLSGVDPGEGDGRMAPWRLSVTLLVGDSPSSASGDRSTLTGALRSLKEELADLLTPASRSALVPFGERGLISVVAADPALLESGGDESLIERSRMRISRVVRRLSAAGEPVTGVTAAHFVSLAELAPTVATLEGLLPLRTLCGLGELHPEERLEELRGVPHSAALAEALMQCARSWAARRSLAFEQAVRDSADILASNPPLRSRVDRIDAFLRSVTCPRAGSLESPADWLPACREELLRGPAAPGSSNGPIVDQVLRYLEDNYTRAIGIGEVAARLGLTPNYLSSLFHKRLGTTFTQHLTRLRMERARALLASGGCSVGEAAAAVGYGSTRHFARLFRTTFGSYPSEVKRSPDGESRRAP